MTRNTHESGGGTRWANRGVRFPKGNSAFTLIELLIVVAIVASLAALLLPALLSAKDSAHTIWCVSNLKQWGVAIEVFVSDTVGRYPVPSWNTGNNGWEDEIQPYIMPGGMNATSLRGSSLVTQYQGVLCPEGPKINTWTLQGTFIGGAYYWMNYYGQTHEHCKGVFYNGCYLYNKYATYFGWIYNGTLQLTTNKNVDVLAPYCFKEGNQKYPAQTALLIEGIWGGSSGPSFSPPPGLGSAIDVTGMAHREYRHRNGKAINVLFFDNHVATYANTTFPETANGGTNGANSIFWKGTADNTLMHP